MKLSNQGLLFLGFINWTDGLSEYIRKNAIYFRNLESNFFWKGQMSEEEIKNIPTVCGSLREAMESLDTDRNFLKEGNVFTDDQIDAYIALKFEEIYNLEHTPHPIEFDMYYSS